MPTTMRTEMMNLLKYVPTSYYTKNKKKLYKNLNVCLRSVRFETKFLKIVNYFVLFHPLYILNFSMLILERKGNTPRVWNMEDDRKRGI